MVARLAAAVPEDDIPFAEPGRGGGWHIDRTIPLALILALLVQTLSIVWWAAKIDERVALLESHDNANLQLIERMARIEEKLGALKDSLQRSEMRLDRLTK